jgi:hypothetical protein
VSPPTGTPPIRTPAAIVRVVVVVLEDVVEVVDDVLSVAVVAVAPLEVATSAPGEASTVAASPPESRQARRRAAVPARFSFSRGSKIRESS